jgi:hypothetical protein
MFVYQRMQYKHNIPGVRASLSRNVSAGNPPSKHPYTLAACCVHRGQRRPEGYNAAYVRTDGSRHGTAPRPRPARQKPRDAPRHHVVRVPVARARTQARAAGKPLASSRPGTRGLALTGF